MKWTEERIRREFQRLDEITGLQAHELPIFFEDPVDGCMAAYMAQGDKPYGFCFAKAYFEEENVLYEANAYDIIRHEYAHYMDHMLTEGDFCSDDYEGHGMMWKACCSMIDALGHEYYSPEQALIDYFFGDPERTKELMESENGPPEED